MRSLLERHYKSISKFAVVGAVNTFIDFGAFFVFHSVFGIWFIFAHFLAFVIALANSFFFNAIWTFGNLKWDQILKQIARFSIIGLIGFVLSSIVIYVAQGYMWVYFAKILAMCVSLSWNYVASWIFVFRD